MTELSTEQMTEQMTERQYTYNCGNPDLFYNQFIEYHGYTHPFS